MQLFFYKEFTVNLKKKIFFFKVSHFSKNYVKVRTCVLCASFFILVYMARVVGILLDCRSTFENSD